MTYARMAETCVPCSSFMFAIVFMIAVISDFMFVIAELSVLVLFLHFAAFVFVIVVWNIRCRLECSLLS